MRFYADGGQLVPLRIHRWRIQRRVLYGQPAHCTPASDWEVKQEYYVGSVCSYKGELYISLSNSNTGNEPLSAQWTLVITAKNGISKPRFGTAAKKDVGTGANQIPDMSAFILNYTLANSTGYQQLPSGLIIQWGVISTGLSDVITTFPMAFPNNCFLATPNLQYTPNSGSIDYITGGALSKTQMVSRSNSASLGGRFIAIGNYYEIFTKYR